MDGGSQIHGWLAIRPARFKKKAAGQAGWMDPARPFFFKNLAGRLASQPCIWLPPIILGLFYWYWYIIRCFLVRFYSFSLKQVPQIQGRVFSGTKKPSVELRRHSDLCLCSIPNTTPKMMPPTISTQWDPRNPILN